MESVEAEIDENIVESIAMAFRMRIDGNKIASNKTTTDVELATVAITMYQLHRRRWLRSLSTNELNIYLTHIRTIWESGQDAIDKRRTDR